MEPLSAIMIASLTFFAKEAGKKLAGKTAEAIATKAGQLRQKIGDKFKGNAKAEEALSQADAGDSDAKEVIADYLKIAMREDTNFADEIQQLAQAINAELKQNEISMTQNILGDHAKGWQTRVEGGTAYIGDIKIYQGQQPDE